VAISNSIVHHIARPEEILQEAVRVTSPGGLLFFRDLLRPDTAEELARLVAQHAGHETAPQQKLFADSLHAALRIDEMQQLVDGLDGIEKGSDSPTIRATSDRHWTWAGRRSTA
jgi:2-polyprenyl-3-methyl-5-hydroxy-6-metoxy-1,4-benzoquinol methylase